MLTITANFKYKNPFDMKPDSTIDLDLLSNGHLKVLNILALKPTKTDQCYSNISVIFVPLLLLQLLQFGTKLKHKSVDFSSSTVYK